MSEWTLAWGDDHRPRVVKDAAHLLELLAEASREAATSHTMVELVSPSGTSCVVGLGRPSSVVTFQESFARPPWYISRGAGTTDRPLVFFYNGHWTEFEAEAAVEVDAALLALREFYETGRRPSAVVWEES